MKIEEKVELEYMYFQNNSVLYTINEKVEGHRESQLKKIAEFKLIR